MLKPVGNVIADGVLTVAHAIHDINPLPLAVTLSPAVVLGMIVVIGLAIAWRVMGPRYWRGDPTTLDSSPPLWWFLSEDAWRGYLRSTPATAPLTVLFGFCGVIAMAFGEGSATGVTFGLIGAALLPLGLALAASVTLWNRPRFVVPPPLRSEPGTRAQRRNRRLREQRRRRR